MGFQLIYWQYLQSINHPILKLLDKSPQSFVGEDIELSLMLLAYFTSSTNITRKTARVDDAYQSLGLLSQIAKQVRDYKISRFGGATKARTAIVYDAQNDAVIKTTVCPKVDSGYRGAWTLCLQAEQHYPEQTEGKERGEEVTQCGIR